MSHSQSVPVPSADGVRKSLRRAGRQVRRAKVGEERTRAERGLVSHVVGLTSLQQGTRVAAFLADDGEPDLAAAFPLLIDRGVELFLPGLVDDGHGGFGMDFRPWSVGHPTEVGPYGIVQPSTTDRMVARELDVVLTPLVAFDAVGARLGRGGGHYDRAFGPTRNQPDRPRMIATAFEAQRVSTIDSQAHDVPLDAAITELGVRWF